MDINTVTLSGRLVRDPEARTTKGGMYILSFSIAVNERKKGASGGYEDYANFIDCTMFGNYAAAISDSMFKSQKVTVSGRLHQSRWEDKEGKKRSSFEIIVNDIVLMQGGQRSNNVVDASNELYDEDVPF